MNRCRYCNKAPNGACGCCCNEHAASRYRTDGGPSLREYLVSKGEA